MCNELKYFVISCEVQFPAGLISDNLNIFGGRQGLKLNEYEHLSDSCVSESLWLM